MDVARRPAGPSDRDFAWTAYSRAYRDLVIRQFGEWKEGPQETAFDEKWDEGGFEIVEADGDPVGAIWTTDEGEFLQLREVFLLPDRQGNGIGSRLVREELATARRCGKPLRLRVTKGNRARELYERLGFRVCGETETQHWMEAV